MGDDDCSCGEKSFGAVLFGAALAAGCLSTMVWNEYDTVQTARAYEQARDLVTNLPNVSTIDPTLEGQLIHIIAPLDTTDRSLRDDLFGVDVRDGNETSLKLRRVVQMRQWVEKRKRTNDKTTYTYDEEWRESFHDSSEFHSVTRRNSNPSEIVFWSREWIANPITLGPYNLSSDAIDDIDWFQNFDRNMSVDDLNFASYGLSEMQDKAKIRSVYYYIGDDPLHSQAGDYRIRFEIARADTASVIAQQTGASLEPFVASNGKEILLVERGTRDSDEMLDQAVANRHAETWLIRIATILGFYSGLCMICLPLRMLVDLVPYVGDVVNCVIIYSLFPVAVVISVFVIDVSIVIFRPKVGLVLITTVGVIVVATYYILQECKRARASLAEGDQAVDHEVPHSPIKVAIAQPVQDNAQVCTYGA